MVSILDNSPEKKIIDSIKNLIGKTEEANFAVGYFFLSGWNLVKDELPDKVKNEFLKILIGRELDFPTYKEISKGYKLRIKTKMLDDLSKIDSKKDISNLKQLYELVKEGVIDFKIYLEGKLHSKLYLFIQNTKFLDKDERFPPGTAIVGSSNFTLSGATINRELNVEFTDKEQVLFLYNWFQNLWNNHSEDFNDDIIEIIKYSNIFNKEKKNPFGIYVPPKVLFKYLSWIWLRGKIEPIEKEDILAQFQLIGVLNAIEIISEYNGVIISDSVGLGKSFIGATIIEEYILGNLPEWDPKSYGINKIRKVLFILPPSLIKQWRTIVFRSGDFFSKNTFKKDSSDKKFVKYSIIGETSHGPNIIGEIDFISLGKFGLFNPEEIYKNKLHEDYDLILIDEAHKFRNSWTNRWRNIRTLRYKKKDNSSSFRNKFLLLTATPINNNIWDVYNLIKIFSDDNFTNFKKRNVQISKLFSEYRDIKIKWKEDKKEEGNLAIKAQEIKNNVFKNVVILRTRKYIMEKFGENGKINLRGKEYSFKDPIPDKISYKNPNKKYSPYNDFINELEKIFEDLEFSFTKLYSSGYVAFNTQQGPEEISEEGNIMIPIGGILKFLLAKRLESSLFAFERTLKKLFNKNNLFYNALNEFIKDLKDLKDDEFFEYVKKISNNFIEIAEKEDIVKEFEEDDVEIEEGRIDPRLRMIFNLIKLSNPVLLKSFEIISREKEFYDYCIEFSEKDSIIKAIKSGIETIFLELERDRKLMTLILKTINEIKEKTKDEEILIVDKYRSNGEIVEIYKYLDPKLEKLKELIYNELNGKKYIIFTQYRDTAKYLYHLLKDWLKDQKITLSYIFSEKGLKLEIVTGELDMLQKEKIIDRFAPIANNAEKYINKNDIEVLVSTDSLSEGVNLQDADGVINYDLPWNPMKIVQRVGRVNRIGNEKDIFVKNFSPSKELETIIGILEKLSSKIKDITFLVGKEFYILSEDEDIKPETFEKKVIDLASAKMSDLEEMSQVGDAKFLGDIIHKEEIAKFKLLNFIQNELKLRKDDYDEIQQYIGKKKILYSLIDSIDTFRVYELYRGTTRSGQYILKLKNEEVIETTCEEFKKLWYATELEKDFKISEIYKKIDILDNYFISEIKEKFKGLKTQTGFINKLFAFLRLKKQHKELTNKKINLEKLNALVNYLPLVEMNTREIGQFKKHLISEGAITEKEDVIDIARLIDSAHDYLTIGEDTERKLNFQILGWCGR
ncbi:MAG: helicase-related protein [Promethearchaeota archaeon]